MSRKYQGKTLEEVVSMQDDKTELYIGSHTAYFFIGKKADFEKRIDKLSEKTLKAFESAAYRSEEERSKLRKQVDNIEQKIDETEIGFASRILNLVQAYSSMVSQAKEAKRRVDNFTPMRTRPVEKFYKRDLPGEEGYSIIVGEDETGKYWLKTEQERDHEKNKRV